VSEHQARQSQQASGEPADAAGSDRRFMRQALGQAAMAQALGEVPVGALVVRQGRVVARGYNRRECDRDPTAHAEILALRAAATALGSWRLNGCTLYVTLEPCAMCAGALVNSRVETLVYGASDPKAGYCGSLGNLVEDARLNHRLTVRRGIMQASCSQVLRAFFESLRREPAAPASGR